MRYRDTLRWTRTCDAVCVIGSVLAVLAFGYEPAAGGDGRAGAPPSGPADVSKPMTFLGVGGILRSPGSVAAPPPPDFSSVTDILAGRRTLLMFDNLVVSGSFYVQFPDVCPHSCSQAPYFFLQTTAPDTLGYVGVLLPFGAEVSPWTPAVLQTTTNFGRVFNQPPDTLVRFQDMPASPFIVPSYTVATSLFQPFPTVQVPPPYNGLGSMPLITPVNTTVLADFNNDGFDDIATNIGPGVLRVGTAVDVKQPSSGIKWPAPPLPTGPFLAMAAGDFNGDGQLDIAGAFYDTDAQIGRLAIYTVDPTTLAVAQVSSITVPSMGPGVPGLGVNGVALTAGRYMNVAADQLVLAVNGQNNSGVQVFSYSVNSQFAITLRDTFAPGLSATTVVARSASLAFFGQTAQVVVGYGSVPGQFDDEIDAFQVLGFDDQLNFQPQSLTRLSCVQCLEDVTIGNFTQGVSPTLEITVLAVPKSLRQPGPPTFSIEGIEVVIYHLDPSTFAPSQASTFAIPSEHYPSLSGQIFRFAAGDTQGLSMRLGPPVKLAISGHIQPQVVLGMPPMHVDWVPPAGSTTPPGVLNVSAVKDSFNSTYETVVTTTNQSSSTGTTSYSYGTMEGGGGGANNALKINGVDLVSVTDTSQTATNDAYTSIVQNTYNTFGSTSFDAATTTGFSDHVWFTAERFNLWIYPVLGQTACSASQPNCDASQRLPLALIFSGPDQVEGEDGDGATLEWYQPVQEPGNVLSYPWSFSQLNPASTLTQLAATPVWFTDTSSQTQFANWSQGGGSNITSGSVAVHSRDTSSSAGASILGFGGGFNVDYYSSSAFGTVNATVSTVGASSGVGVAKPGTFLKPPLYQYPVQNFIFGETVPEGTAQTIPLDTTVATTGVLQSLFIADPSGVLGQAGIWWKQTYAQPDVALNHPVRWTSTSTTSPTGSNCLRINSQSSASDCLTFNAPDLDDLPTSEFHWMRGFFITPASANGQGPQTVQATAGDQLLLQVRIYNYSLVDMPAGTKVHARFYGQKVTTKGHFEGPSFLIGEAVIDPIPGFNSPTAGSNPNWSMAGTTFDTTPYPDTNLVFWVVVWMEDASGGLVPEMADHGLTQIPGTLTSLADVPIEAHSNNVGYYNQSIYIAPPSGATATKSAAPQSPFAITDVKLESGVSGHGVNVAVVKVPDKTVVAATLRAGEADESGLLVRFFDGHPAHGGRMFDVEMVPRIGGGQTWTARVPFRPKTCGVHRIWVAAHDQLTYSPPLVVFCSPGIPRVPGDSAEIPP
ncbi:MAG TPA: VCBS repeat-containing protein [Candidatus Methylomirabilis sp.]|nr:VCBS repeat-containing protein [Candidatus Methylomirabilis sp.]